MGVRGGGGWVNRRNGILVGVGGCVIVRQRPGTAKGIVFLSVEDETGIFNVIVMPDVFEANRMTIVRSPYLLVEGPLQKYEGVIHVQARKIEAIRLSAGAASSHDFNLCLPQTRISLQQTALGHSLLISAVTPARTVTHR